MAASPAEPAPFGCTIRADATLRGPASHDGTGRRFVLVPPAGTALRFALDVERRDRPAPAALARVLGPRAMERWGEIEVIAKLTDLPAHLVLRRVLAGGAGAAEATAALAQAQGLRLARCDTAELWRVVGCRPG
jgi:hypothetical protein